MNLRRTSLLLVAIANFTCSSQEPVQVPAELLVRSDQARAPFSNDLGYVIELERVRVIASDFAFTTGGETHEDVLPDGPIVRRVFGSPRLAWAHPGHSAGGDVIGELLGRFVFDFTVDGSIGTATLIEGSYEGANFGLATADTNDVPEEDPLVGFNMSIEGTATLADETVRWSAFVDQDEGREVVGAPFDQLVMEGFPLVLELELLPFDDIEGLSLVDGIDFVGLDDDEDGLVELSAGSEGLNRLRRALQSHTHYRVTAHATQPHEDTTHERTYQKLHSHAFARARRDRMRHQLFRGVR